MQDMRKNISVMLAMGACALFPALAFADVRINEIAWMGGVVSGTDEWIELWNDAGEVVSLDGYTIEATDGSPVLALRGTIASGGYFLIERTDDSTVPDIPADLILPFGNGLSNSGETLLLKSASGVTLDTVVGGDEWTNIGGDNVTKETAQRTPSGWVTGVSTPRASNVSSSGGEVLGASTSTTVAVTQSAPPTSGGGTKAVSPYPRSDITVVAGDDQRAFASFPVMFTGSAKGFYDEDLPSATYRWNFGDGATGVGKSVTHTYVHPGDYLVTLAVYWGNTSRTDRLSVSVLAPNVLIESVSADRGGFVALKNYSEREINISGWKLRDEHSFVEFVFPENSVVLPGKTFVLASSVSGIVGTTTALTLLFPDGAVEHEWTTPSPLKKNTKSVTLVTSHASPAPMSVTRDTFATTTASGTEHVLWKRDPIELGAGMWNMQLSVRHWFYFLAVIFLVVLSLVVLFRVRKNPSDPADEYTIIEGGEDD